MALETLPLPIQILGVNATGLESGNALNCAGRDLPWLQDTTADGAWGLWGATWRDVVILDQHQAVFAVYNLTTHDLGVAANATAFKQLLRDAANVP